MRTQPDSDAARSLSRLTERQLAVLRLIGQGWTSGEIADRLGISTRMVQEHRARIRLRLSLPAGSSLRREGYLAVRSTIDTEQLHP